MLTLRKEGQITYKKMRFSEIVSSHKKLDRK